MQRRLDHAEEPELAAMRSFFKIGLCTLAIAISTPVNAQQLGRLFFTPDQRKQLDYTYAQGGPTENYNNALMLNGIVQKHGGKRTAWINGVPQAAGRSDEQSPESVAVPLPGQNKSVKLKVGQRVLLNPATSPDTNAAQNQGSPER
jgi:hypothetical protein